MRALVLKALDDVGPLQPDHLQWESVPDPVPLAGCVVVRLENAALNHRDLWIRKGQYAGIKLPAILGSDGAGVVAAVGEGVDARWLGKAVVMNPSLDWGDNPAAQGTAFSILGLPEHGTHAELVKVSAANLVEMPSHLSFAEAAALPLAGVTAFRALKTRAQVQAGETVLVTGAGGGVSGLAVQIATALGARVFVTSRQASKIEQAKALGALDGVSTESADWPRDLVKLTGKKVDVVIDSIGGDIFAQAMEALTPGGRLVSYGATLGLPKALNLRRLFWGQLNLLGSTMGSEADFAAFIALVAQTKLVPQIDQVLALSDANKAYARMESGEHFGKIVLACRE